MNWLAITTMAILGIGLLLLGLRGRRLNDHPTCRRCGADLVNLRSGDATCPECKHSLEKKRARRVGARQRRPLMIVLGASLLLLGSATGGFIWGMKSDPYDWMKAMPTWVIVKIAQRDEEPMEEAALGELVRRLDGDHLSRWRSSSIAQLGLELQANDLRAWNDQWAKFIETAWKKELLSEEQMRRYGRQSFRPRFIMSAELPRRGSWYCHLAVGSPRAGHEVLLTGMVERMIVGEEEVEFRGTLERRVQTSMGIRDQAMRGRVRMALDRRTAQPTWLKPGAHDVQCTWHVRYAIGERHVEETLAFTARTFVTDRDNMPMAVWTGGPATQAELLAAFMSVDPPTVDMNSGGAYVRGIARLGQHALHGYV